MYSFKYFTIEEFRCKETGVNFINPSFVAKLDQLREACGFPFVITSGYRSPDHSVEKRKPKPGTHAQGIAADIKADDKQAYVIMKEAFKLGFTGIARGKGFVHLDVRSTDPVVWSY
jgi:zinc D-Ala-D-Ala carboxypeptidase